MDGIDHGNIYTMVIIGGANIGQLKSHTSGLGNFRLDEKIKLPGGNNIRIVQGDQFLDVRKHEMVHMTMGEQQKVHLAEALERTVAGRGLWIGADPGIKKNDLAVPGDKLEGAMPQPFYLYFPGPFFFLCYRYCLRPGSRGKPGKSQGGKAGGQRSQKFLSRTLHLCHLICNIS